MDTVKITILEDGTIKTETDKVSMANHSNAEGFLRQMFHLAGGSCTRVFKHGLHVHEHEHSHEHDHQHQ
jgi:hypothetical protein